jgi:deazaflavin-dependent oxidoreductase (nitroreductase family)
MDEQIRQALANDRVIDITTTGRKSGKRHRVETSLFHDDGRIYLTGLPGRRDWYANLLANPDFTLHLKQSVSADLPAHATPITDPEARRAILGRIVGGLGRTQELDAWVESSPLAVVSFDGTGPRS